MKILILSDGFPPEKSGGAERIANNLFEGLKTRSYEVFVLTTTQNKDKVENGENNIFRIYVPNYVPSFKSYFGLYNPWAIFKAKKIIQKVKPDIIHFHNIHYYLSYHLFKAAKKSGAKTFLTAHDADLFLPTKLKEFIKPQQKDVPLKFNYKVTAWQQFKRLKKRYNPFRNSVIRHYLKYLDKIFAVSHVLKEALEQNGIQNIGVVHNGINTNEWQMGDNELQKFRQKFGLVDKKIVLYVGRLETLKGVRQLILAMNLVGRVIPNAMLVAAADSKKAQNFITLAKEKNVTFSITGWLARNEMKAAYWSSNVVTVPSIYLDPFPTVNLEAMACQKPIVGTCFGGTSEVVENNKTGFIVNPLNVKETAEKIIDLLKSSQKALEFGQAGYQRVKENFSLERQIQEILKYV